MLEGLGIRNQLNACDLKGILMEATAVVLGETLGLQFGGQGQRHQDYHQHLLLSGMATAIGFSIPLSGSGSVQLAYTYQVQTFTSSSLDEA